MAEVVSSEELVEEASDYGHLRAGTQLGRYELLVPVARGGMARVWAARQHGQRGFQKLVAIKTILPELAREAEFERMFLDEARIASGVHHPNVCEIYELGEEQRVLYMAMEWVNGDSLARLLRPKGTNEKLDPRVAARIVADAAAGAHAAHELEGEGGEKLGVVHRDLSPHNVLLTLDGVGKVCDFGVAKAYGQLHDATSAGQLKGKIAYMAPEQITGGAIDRRSDVFSLGILLYEASTGERPFKGEADHQVMHAVLKGEFAPPSTVVPGYPVELERIVQRALASQPAQRFPTAERMWLALEEFLAGGPLVTQADVGRVLRGRLAEPLDRRKERIRAAHPAGEGPPSSSPRTKEPPQRSAVKETRLPATPAPASPEPRAESAVAKPGLKVTRPSVSPPLPSGRPSAPPPALPSARPPAVKASVAKPSAAPAVKVRRGESDPPPSMKTEPSATPALDAASPKARPTAPPSMRPPATTAKLGPPTSSKTPPPPPTSKSGATPSAKGAASTAKTAPPPSVKGPASAAKTSPPAGVAPARGSVAPPRPTAPSTPSTAPPRPGTSPSLASRGPVSERGQLAAPAIPLPAPLPRLDDLPEGDEGLEATAVMYPSATPQPPPAYTPAPTPYSGHFATGPQQMPGWGQAYPPHAPYPMAPQVPASTAQPVAVARSNEMVHYALAAVMGLAAAGLIAAAAYIAFAPSDERSASEGRDERHAPSPTSKAVTGATREVLLEATPPDAEISVDGRVLPPGSGAVARPPVGTVLAVTMRAPGHRDRTVLVDFFSPAKVAVALEKAPPSVEPEATAAPAPTVAAAPASAPAAAPAPPPTAAPAPTVAAVPAPAPTAAAASAPARKAAPKVDPTLPANPY